MQETLFILIPLFAAFSVTLCGRLHRRVAELIACAAGALLTLLAFWQAVRSLGAAVPLVYALDGFSAPAGTSLVVDGLAAFMLVVANVVTCAVLFYSTVYMRRYTDTWKYYALVMIMAAGVNGVVLSGDIFTVFVYLEIASVATYALVAFGTDKGSLEAAFKYAVMSAVASAFLLLGIAFLYSATGTLQLAGIASSRASGASSAVYHFAAALVFMGLGVKAALFPFHTWMPDAYTDAPAPVAALSSGVIVKTLGVYAIARLFFNVFGMGSGASALFIGLAVLSMVVGAILAFGQKNLKRLLGYSSISQIGYVFLGLGVGTPLAVTAALFHLLNHSVGKALLFMSAGDVEMALGTDDLSRMRNIAPARPLAACAGMCGAFSICGLPPFAGFWSKLLLVLACLQAGRPWLAFIAVAVSVLTIAYYWKAYAPMLTGEPARTVAPAQMHRRSVLVNVAVISLTAIALAGGALLLPGKASALIARAAAALSGGDQYAARVHEVTR